MSNNRLEMCPYRIGDLTFYSFDGLNAEQLELILSTAVSRTGVQKQQKTTSVCAHFL